MIKNIIWFVVFIALSIAFFAGCGEMGKVDQGRVIAYDETNATVTILTDKNANPEKPEYILPPRIYALPKDPHEIGPTPKAGKRIKLDTKNNQIIIFDDENMSLKTIPYQVLDSKENIEKENPLVYDKQEKKAKKFPVIDKKKKSITIYSKRQKILVTFTLPDKYFTLPDDTWDSGDEVRIFYHEEGKSLRFMNISKTDIFKK